MERAREKERKKGLTSHEPTGRFGNRTRVLDAPRCVPDVAVRAYVRRGRVVPSACGQLAWVEPFQHHDCYDAASCSKRISFSIPILPLCIFQPRLSFLPINIQNAVAVQRDVPLTDNILPRRPLRVRRRALRRRTLAQKLIRYVRVREHFFEV